MWNYEKRLQYPVKITQTNPKIAQIILTQFGGPDGELAASMRYLAQRYTMPYKEVTGILTDIGTEELAHLEIICAIVHQLTRNLTPEQIEKSGFDKYYVDHTLALWPQAASGTPWSATTFQSKGDPITDLHEDMAAEQKARTTYDNILRLVKDPEVCDPIRFLREREIEISYIPRDLITVIFYYQISLNPLKTQSLSQVSFPLLFPLRYIVPPVFTNSDKGKNKGKKII